MTILYFVAGFPSDKQKDLARKAGAKIRDSSAYHEGDTMENCDAVMGDVPKEYADRFELSEHDKAAKRLVKTASKTAEIAEPETTE